MTSSNEARTNREYLTCLDGGGIHSWESRGLGPVGASLFPRARARSLGNTVLCSTRGCVWCGIEQAKLYPDGSRWKPIAISADTRTTPRAAVERAEREARRRNKGY